MSRFTGLTDEKRRQRRLLFGNNNTPDNVPQLGRPLTGDDFDLDLLDEQAGIAPEQEESDVGFFESLRRGARDFADEVNAVVEPTRQRARDFADEVNAVIEPTRQRARDFADEVNAVIEPTRQGVREGNALRRQARREDGDLIEPMRDAARGIADSVNDIFGPTPSDEQVAQQAENLIAAQSNAEPAPSDADPEPSDPLADGVDGDETDRLFRIRQARNQLSRDIRRERSQNLQVRQDLNRQRQALLREGRDAEARAVLRQIQQIRNSTLDDEENLRDLVRAESQLRPRQSDADRQAGRNALNAQLPGIRDAFAAQAETARDAAIERFSEVGADLVRLELGQDPSDFSPEALAKFAISASPEVIDRVTNGVGLGDVPGGEVDADVQRIQDLINNDNGGVQFGDPLERLPTDPQVVDRALDFVGDLDADRQAGEIQQDAQRANETNAAIFTQQQGQNAVRQVGGTPVVPGFDGGLDDGLGNSLFRGAGRSINRQENTDVDTIELVSRALGDQANTEAGRSVIETVRQINEGRIATAIQNAASGTDDAELSQQIRLLDNVFNVTGLNPNIRRTLAQQVLDQVETAQISSGGFFDDLGDLFGAAANNIEGFVESLPLNLLSGIGLARFLTGRAGEVGTAEQNFAADLNQRREQSGQDTQAFRTLEAFKNRLRAIISNP